MIKSLIHKIKERKNFHNFLQEQMDETEKKMSKKKEQIVKSGISKKKIISHIYIFFKRTSRNFDNSMIKSLIFPIKHYKKFHNFLTTLDR